MRSMLGRLSGVMCVLCALSLSACEEARRTSLSAPSTVGGAQVGVQAGESQGGEPHPTQPPVALSARAPRRLSVAQLAQTIEVVTGGVRWIEDLGQGPVDMLTLLAPTLGAADFRSVTHESLEPSLLMSKFVQDGAQRVCATWVSQEQNPETRKGSLLKPTEGTSWESLEPAYVRAQLSRLLLRFFAYSAQAEVDPRVEALYELFSMVSEASPTDPVGDGWRATCLALMTDPEFLLY